MIEDDLHLTEPGEPAEQPIPFAAPPPRVPVWGWADAALFFTCAIPCLLLAEMGGVALAKLLHVKPDMPAVLVGSQGVAYAALFLILAKILDVNYGAPFWQSLGWVPSRMSSGAAIGTGILLAFGLALVGGLLRIPDVDSPMQKMLEAPYGAVILAVFGTTVAPVAEELAFRGFLQPLAVRTAGTVAGILLTSVLFGLLHLEQNGDSWAHVGLITVAGIAFGVLRHLSGSLRTSILAHAAYNSTLFLAFFAYGRNLKH